MRRIAINRVVFFQSLTVLLLLGLLGFAAYTVWVKHDRVQGILTDLEPRYARLQGLLDHQAEIQAMDAKAKETLLQMAFPATQDLAKTGNDAQQRIRSLFADSRLDIISIQILPGKVEGDFDRIVIHLRIEGAMSDIQAALGRLAEQSPAVLVDNMSLQSTGGVRPASVQRIAGQFVFSVFRVRL
jgi:general secretion pathway protein M